MAFVNHSEKAVHFKIVYAGPAGAGKTTNLRAVCQRLSPQLLPGAMTPPAPDAKASVSPMLYDGAPFDYVPTAIGELRGHTLHYALYSVPEALGNARDIAIKGADAVVLVTDPRPEGLAETEATMRALATSFGRTWGSLPLVLQCNKRDLTGGIAKEVAAQKLGLPGINAIDAVAASGQGVLETLKEIIKMLLQSFSRSGALN
jgi:signal recognition particle receptor subunit beta